LAFSRKVGESVFASVRRWVSFGLGGAWLLCASFLFAQGTVPAVLSDGADAAQSPSLAALANGNCAVAWVEKSGPDRTLIVVRRRAQGQWLPVETLVPSRPSTQVSSPVLHSDGVGNLHLLWVEASAETSSLQYAFQAGAAWISYGAVNEATDWKIEKPSLEFADNTLFFAWQERAGSNYRIRSLVIDPLGDTYSFALAGQSDTSRVLYPEFVRLPEGLGLCWYDLDEERAGLKLRRWSAETREWAVVPTPNWNDELLQALPMVASTPDHGPFLIGYDRVGNYDQIFLSSEILPRAYLDYTPFAQNRSPRVSRPASERLGLIWQQETNQGVSLLQGALIPGEGLIQVTPLADVNAFIAPEPDVAISDELLLTVWVAPRPGGEGLVRVPSVYFAETPVVETAWETILPVFEEAAP